MFHPGWGERGAGPLRCGVGKRGVGSLLRGWGPAGSEGMNPPYPLGKGGTKGEGRIHPSFCHHPRKFQLVLGSLCKRGGFGVSSLGVAELAGGGFQCGLYCWGTAVPGLSTPLFSIPNTPNAGPGARLPFTRRKSSTLETGPEDIGKLMDLEVSCLKMNGRKGRFLKMFWFDEFFKCCEIIDISKQTHILT